MRIFISREFHFSVAAVASKVLTPGNVLVGVLCELQFDLDSGLYRATRSVSVATVLTPENVFERLRGLHTKLYNRPKSVFAVATALTPENMFELYMFAMFQAELCSERKSAFTAPVLTPENMFARCQSELCIEL